MAGGGADSRVRGGGGGGLRRGEWRSDKQCYHRTSSAVNDLTVKVKF